MMPIVICFFIRERIAQIFIKQKPQVTKSFAKQKTKCLLGSPRDPALRAGPTLRPAFAFPPTNTEATLRNSRQRKSPLFRGGFACSCCRHERLFEWLGCQRY